MHSGIKDQTLKEADKLVLVQLLNGEQRCLLIHIEIESHPENFPERMFRYFYLLWETLRTNPSNSHLPPSTTLTALVLYVGSRVPKIFDRFEYDAFGTSLTYRFNTYLIKEQSEAELLANPNPFAIIVLATLYVQRTMNDHEQRLTFKEEVYRLAKERGYSQQLTNSILCFIEEFMRLPKALNKQFYHNISQPRTTPIMPYMTENTRNLADAMTKGAFGVSYYEQQAALSQKDAALSQQQAALSQQQAALSQKDAALAKTIKELRVEMQMSPERIANMMGIAESEVRETLAKENLL